MAIEKKNAIAFFSLKLTSKTSNHTNSQSANKNFQQKNSFWIGFLPMKWILFTKLTQQTENSPLYVYDYPFLTVSDIEETLGFYPPDFVQCIVIDP
jgi:hypothetical protein